MRLAGAGRRDLGRRQEGERLREAGDETREESRQRVQPSMSTSFEPLTSQIAD